MGGTHEQEDKSQDHIPANTPRFRPVASQRCGELVQSQASGLAQTGSLAVPRQGIGTSNYHRASPGLFRVSPRWDQQTSNYFEVFRS